MVLSRTTRTPSRLTHRRALRGSSLQRDEAKGSHCAGALYLVLEGNNLLLLKTHAVALIAVSWIAETADGRVRTVGWARTAPGQDIPRSQSQFIHGCVPGAFGFQVSLDVVTTGR
jgi:hypothetical protein